MPNKQDRVEIEIPVDVSVAEQAPSSAATEAAGTEKRQEQAAEAVTVSTQQPAVAQKEPQTEITPTQTPAPSLVVKTAQQKKIENILEEGLSDIYFSLPAVKQQEFKVKGEETVIAIDKVLEQAKIKIKKIIDLVKGWLMIIPGLNKFFVEQEAKIKADKIVKLKKS